MAFAANGTTVASANGTSDIYLFDAATGKLTADLTDPQAASGTENAGVETLAFAPNGLTLAAVDGSNTYLWDTASRKLTATLADQEPACCSELTAAAFATNGTTVATADSEGKTYLWHITAPTP